MDDNTVPRPRSVRLDTLELSSTEAFVLSQIDGAATLDNVADATGIALDSVISIARRLEQLGAIECPSARSRVRASGRYADVAPPTPSKPPPGTTLDQVPRRTASDVYGMALETGDAFLLSNVDGHFSVQDLAEILGDDAGRVTQRVDALVRAGALELHQPRKRGSGPVTPSPSKVTDPPQRSASRSGAHVATGGAKSSRRLSSATPIPGAKSGRLSQAKLRAAKVADPAPARSKTPVRESKTFRGPRAGVHDRDAPPRHPVLEGVEPSQVPFPPAAVPRDDQACDLDAESCARIDAALAAHERRSHYALLDVPMAASAKEISRAYFARVSTLHPDRYFGKRLGPYKKKLEQAFRTVTEAYDVLRSPARRIEYDGYLRLTRKSVEMEAALTAPRVSAPAAPVSAPAPRVSAPPAPVSAPAPHVSAPPAPVSAPAPRVSAPPAPVSAPAPRVSAPPAPVSVPAVAAQEAAAPPSSPRAPPAQPAIEARPNSTPISRAPPSPPVPSVASPAAKTKRQSLGQGLAGAAKSASLLEEAQRALIQGDVAAAANLYRLALRFADDPTVRAYAESGLKEARSLLADTYLKSAVYEEKESRWTEAVASYEKALDRRPEDPAICERLANALRQEGQDLVRATRLAELAVSRTPRSAACKRTLGLIYADAGSREKALQQFEKALELDPTDEATNRAIAVLRKGRR